MANPDSSRSGLPEWLRGDPVAEHLRTHGHAITKAAWLEAADGSSSETVRPTFPSIRVARSTTDVTSCLAPPMSR